MEFNKPRYERNFNFRLKNTIISYPNIYFISKKYHPPLLLCRIPLFTTYALPRFMHHGMKDITNCWLISLYRLRLYSKKGNDVTSIRESEQYDV